MRPNDGFKRVLLQLEDALLKGQCAKASMTLRQMQISLQALRGKVCLAVYSEGGPARPQYLFFHDSFFCSRFLESSRAQEQRPGGV